MVQCWFHAATGEKPGNDGYQRMKSPSGSHGLTGGVAAEMTTRPLLGHIVMEVAVCFEQHCEHHLVPDMSCPLLAQNGDTVRAQSVCSLTTR